MSHRHDDLRRHTIDRLNSDVEARLVPPNPKHGEPGHECPLDHWFEYRLQGIDAAMIEHALSNQNALLKARVIAEAIAGEIPAEELDKLIRTGEKLEELMRRIAKPLDDEYADQRAEWAKYKEFNL